MPLPQLVTPETLAEWAGVPLGTVYRWNYAGTGPRPIRVGRHVRYTEAEVVRWLEQQSREVR